MKRDNFAFKPKPEPEPENNPKKGAVAKATFIINATRAGREEIETFEEHTRKSFAETIDLLRQGIAYEFTPVGIMEQRDQAFGPFEDRKTASFMIPSELDEKGKDWKGHRWTYGVLPMIWETFVDPNFQVPRVYWCRECNQAQSFKGSCGHCKSNGKKFVKTLEVKDWEGDF